MRGKEIANLLTQRREGKELDKKRPNPIVLWLLAAAVVFLAVSGFWERAPNGDAPKTPETENAADDTGDYLARMEARLAETLERIDGAGEVTVLITVDSGGQRVLATDQRTASSSETGPEATGASQQESEATVVLSGQSSSQSPYVVEEKLPAPVGVLVVAQGAKEEAVRYEMYEAVRALFGLAAHRIKIAY